jgi:hypothetical protein
MGAPAMGVASIFARHGRPPRAAEREGGASQCQDRNATSRPALASEGAGGILTDTPNEFGALSRWPNWTSHALTRSAKSGVPTEKRLRVDNGHNLTRRIFAHLSQGGSGMKRPSSSIFCSSFRLAFASPKEFCTPWSVRTARSPRQTAGVQTRAQGKGFRSWCRYLQGKLSRPQGTGHRRLRAGKSPRHPGVYGRHATMRAPRARSRRSTSTERAREHIRSQGSIPTITVSYSTSKARCSPCPSTPPPRSSTITRTRSGRPAPSRRTAQDVARFRDVARPSRPPACRGLTTTGNTDPARELSGGHRALRPEHRVDGLDTQLVNNSPHQITPSRTGQGAKEALMSTAAARQGQLPVHLRQDPCTSSPSALRLPEATCNCTTASPCSLLSEQKEPRSPQHAAELWA